MGKCAFCGKLSNNKEKATLHRFPRDESSWKKWVKIIEREGWIPTQSSFLCSDHFTEESFCWYDNNRTKKRLKPGVLPMICSKIKFEPESDILSTNNCRDQLNSMSDSNKTSIVYENDESVEIKEEIIEERHQGGEHKFPSEKSKLDEKSISSGNKSAVKTEIVYESDGTLEIKEEIIPDTEAVTGHKLNKKCVATLNTVDTREASSLAANKLRSRKKKKIHESKAEPEEEYKCQKCARTYKYKHNLNAHQKFNCGITTLFVCKFCDKRFKQKSYRNNHIVRVHQRTNSNQNREKFEKSKQKLEKKHNRYRHQKTNTITSQTSYNCNKCFRSYSSLKKLNKHASLKHAAVEPKFTCDVCDYKTYMKSNLSKHISRRHFKNSKTLEARHNCDKCFRSYSSLDTLKRHERLKHAAVKPQFICDVCDFKTNTKSNLSIHISSSHFKNSTPQARHTCDKCSQSYSSLNNLKRHVSLKHTEVGPKFVCDVCDFKTYMKSDLSKHFFLHHFKNSSQARHNCDKCFQNYNSLGALKRHNRFKHAANKPEFTCDFCGYKTYMKSCLSSHISSRHLKNSLQPRHNCDKCSRNYSSFAALKRHKRLKHAAVKLEFSCGFCDYKTNVKYSVLRHISSLHFKIPKTS